MDKYTLRATYSPTDLEGLGEYPHLLASLMKDRGVVTRQDAESFLKPDYENSLHSPHLLKGIKEAVDRFVLAIKKGERIAVFCDYDHDGIPGAVIATDFFQKIGYENYEIYIPHRHDEGFGMNNEALLSLKERGATLLVTVDCGINNVVEIKYAKDLGIDTIVTDHHMQTVELHDVFAIVNPNQFGCEYPNKFLCGSAVFFKFIQVVIEKISEDEDLRKTLTMLKAGWEKWLLDMVGIATLSDMVSLTGENRTLAYFGLQVLRKSRRPGLLRLLSKLGVFQSRINEDDVGFSISPRINAASRMGVSRDAYKLLSAENEEDAARLVDKLEKVNAERKGVVASMVKELNVVIAERYQGKSGKVIVAGNPKWRPSLLGLAANTLVQKYGSPVFLWGRDGGGRLKGSCRAPSGISLLEIMKGADCLTEFGGHQQSGGFAIDSTKVHMLEGVLQSNFEKLNHVAENPIQFVDLQLDIESVNRETVTILNRLRPFGVGNKKPLIMFQSVTVDYIKEFGKEKNHLEIGIKKTGGTVKAIAFFSTRETFPALTAEGAVVSLVGTMEESFFAGRYEVRVRIDDIVKNEKN